MKLKSGFITVDADETELESIMNEADEWSAYNQSNIEIVDNGIIVAYRSWCGCTDGLDDQENPIGFGELGYYADWVILESAFNVRLCA